MAGRQMVETRVANQAVLKPNRNRDTGRQEFEKKEVLVKKLGRGLLKRRMTKEVAVPVVHAVTLVVTFFCLQILRPHFTTFQLRENRGLEFACATRARGPS